VELEPIAGGKVQALVRRKTGRVYGFEFLSLTEQSQLISKVVNPFQSTKATH
jgi:hypothetical protein